MSIPRAEYEKLMGRQGTCVIDGKTYRRLKDGTVAVGTDICVSHAIPGSVVSDGGVLVYYRLLPPPPPPKPTKDVLGRVKAGEGTAEEIALLAVWAEHALKK